MAALTPGYTRTKVLITVKTYPQPSRRHREVVCTAGITSEGEWIRLYPIDFRILPREKQFSKYQWIEVDLAPKGQANDNRKESRRPNLDSLEILGPPLPTDHGWRERRKYIDRLSTSTMLQYEEMYKQEKVSLGLVKPSRVLDVVIEPVQEKWRPEQEQIINQLNLLVPNQEPLTKIPFKFSYVFECEDCEKPYTRMIEDWELGALYRNEVRRLGSAEEAAQSVKNKYLEDIFAPSRDSHLFVGTTFPWNTWVVIGVYWPPKQFQTELDFES